MTMNRGILFILVYNYGSWNSFLKVYKCAGHLVLLSHHMVDINLKNYTIMWIIGYYTINRYLIITKSYIIKNFQV